MTMFLIVFSGIVTAPEQASGASDRAAWLREAQWGVFTHYMADTVIKEEPITIEAWNRAVDGFDVAGLADDLASVGAGYYVITLGQNSGFYCSPNPVYDKLTGISPSKCSRRDLIADLYEALHARNIRLMLYLPSGAPDRDADAVKALEWQPGKYPYWSFPKGGPDAGLRLASFQKKWEAVIREWAGRYGAKVSGWWFDGCYYPHEMYYHDDPPNFASFAAAARAGNPQAIVAFNPGVLDPIITLSEHEDYTAGEINDPEKVKCPGPKVEHAQFHMLSYLGPWWCQSPPRFTDEQVIAITRGIVEKGGAVTWDVPIEKNGHIPEPFLNQLRALGKALPRQK